MISGFLYFRQAASALTSLSAAQLTGTVPLASLPGAVVTNNETGVTHGSLTVSNLLIAQTGTNIVPPAGGVSASTMLVNTNIITLTGGDLVPANTSFYWLSSTNAWINA